MSTTSHPRRAALLVDWENLRAGMTRRSFRYPPREIAARLIKEVEALAQKRGATLYYKTAFASSEVLGKTGKDLQDGGLTVLPSTTAKNAADTLLIVEAMRRRLKDGYEEFFIVSGDVDYIDLLRALQQEAGSILFMPLDGTNLTAEVRRFEPKQFVKDLLSLEEKPPPPVDDISLFCLLAQLTILNNKALSFHKARDEFARAFAGSDTDPETLWDTAKIQRSLRVGELVGERKVNRPMFETPSVTTLYLSTDVVLDLVRRRSERGGCRYDDAVHAPEHDLLLSEVEECQRHIDTMIRAGLLTRQGDNIAIAMPGAERGIVRPFLTMAFIAWCQALTTQWTEVPKWKLGNRWPHHVRGGRLPKHELDLYSKAGEALVDASAKMGLLAWQTGASGKSGFAVRWEHPLAHQMRTSIWALLDRLEEFLGDDTSGDFDEFIRQTNEIDPPSAAIAPESILRFWLSVLRGEDIVVWYTDKASGRRRIQLKRNKAFFSLLRDTGSPPIAAAR